MDRNAGSAKKRLFSGSAHRWPELATGVSSAWLEMSGKVDGDGHYQVKKIGGSIQAFGLAGAMQLKVTSKGPSGGRLTYLESEF